MASERAFLHPACRFVLAVALLGLLSSSAEAQTSGSFSDGFEDGTLLPFATGGSASWYTTTSDSYSGSWSARAGSIGDSQSTYIQLTHTLSGSGTISFAMRVSSEASYDFLTFYIDGVSHNSWSGESGWLTDSHSVASGTHTFKWEFSRDYCCAGGSDTAWIDDVAITDSASASGGWLWIGNGNTGYSSTSSWTTVATASSSATKLTLAGWGAESEATISGDRVNYDVDLQSTSCTITGRPWTDGPEEECYVLAGLNSDWTLSTATSSGLHPDCNIRYLASTRAVQLEDTVASEDCAVAVFEDTAAAIPPLPPVPPSTGGSTGNEYSFSPDPKQGSIVLVPDGCLIDGTSDNIDWVEISSTADPTTLHVRIRWMPVSGGYTTTDGVHLKSFHYDGDVWNEAYSQIYTPSQFTANSWSIDAFDYTIPASTQAGTNYIRASLMDRVSSTDAMTGHCASGASGTVVDVSRHFDNADVDFSVLPSGGGTGGAVDGSSDYIEFNDGQGLTWATGTVYTITAPDGNTMTVTKTGTGGSDGNIAGAYLDGTNRGASGWTAVGSLDGSPADGTWTITAAQAAGWPYESSGVQQPPVRLVVQGKSICYGFSNTLAVTNSPQIWNWHITPAGTEFQDHGCASLVDVDSFIEPDEDPTLVKYAIGGLPPTPGVGDSDGDGFTDAGEVGGGSQPLFASSTPDTDDDGDGLANRDASDSPWQSLYSGAYGLVLENTASDGYAGPTSAEARGLYYDVDDQNRFWAWDAHCSYASGGDYDSCRGDTGATSGPGSSNYDASDELYAGDYAEDGYGWRRLTDPVEEEETVTVATIQDPRDGDLDGVYAVDLCSMDVILTVEGDVVTPALGSPYGCQAQGDPDDGDPSDPLPTGLVVCDEVEPAHEGDLDRVRYNLGLTFTHQGNPQGACVEDTLDGPLPLTTQEYPYDYTLGPDADSDGIPAYIEFRYRETTVDADGAVTHSGTTRTEQEPVDPDDNDPTWPIPVVTDGPHSTLEPSSGDGVHYRFGLALTVQGDEYDLVFEDTLDAGVLPHTVTVPAGAPPTPGPDEDGDGIPAYYEVEMVDVTINDDEGHSTSTTPAEPTRIPVDPDDVDDSWPVPRVEGPYTSVERDTGDGVRYKLGARFTVKGIPLDLVEEDTLDAGALPHAVTVPTGEAPTPGPDLDGDGLPAYLEVPMEHVTINDDEDLSTSEEPAEPLRVPVDPDDETPVVPDLDPVTLTVLFVPSPGVDGDGDGLWNHVTLQAYDVTFDDGAASPVTVSRNESADVAQGVDPDDGDPDDPAPSPGSVDGDGDGVPDAVEPDLCEQNNPFFNFDGTCEGDDYSPPTVEGIIEDLEEITK